MSRKRKILVSIALFTICLGAGMFLLPFTSGSTDGVHESLKAIKQPFLTAAAESYLDGGSIGLRVVDAEGTTHLFALPVNPSAPKQQFTTFYPGAMYLMATNRSAALPLDKATKRYFCYLLERDTQGSKDADIALMELRGAPRDYLPLVVWFFKQMSPFDAEVTGAAP